MYEKLVDRLRCPNIHSCPVDKNKLTCRQCQKNAIREAAEAITKLRKDAEQFQTRLNQIEQERDAAISDLDTLRKKTGRKCEFCYYDIHYDRNVCDSCEYNDGNNWSWRGIER